MVKEEGCGGGGGQPMVTGKEQMHGVQLKTGHKNSRAKDRDGDRLSGTAERPGLR